MIEKACLGSGLTGQAVFAARLLVQLIASGREGESVVPIAFWYSSPGGAATLVACAVRRRDPIFALTSSFGFAACARTFALVGRANAADHA